MIGYHEGEIVQIRLRTTKLKHFEHLSGVYPLRSTQIYLSILMVGSQFLIFLYFV